MTYLATAFRGRPRLIAITSLACALTSASVSAQESHLYASRIPGSFGVGIGTLEVDGGAFYSSEMFDVSGELIGGDAFPIAVEWVGSEVWLSLGNSNNPGAGIQRLTWPGLQSAGRLQPGVPADAIVPTASGATVFGGGPQPAVIEYDFAGTELTRTPFMRVQDAAPFANGWIVIAAATGAPIIAGDSGFLPIGSVGTGFPALADALHREFYAEKIIGLSNGDYAIGASNMVGIMDSAGTALSVFSPGLLEINVLELTGGEIYVPAEGRPYLLDPATGAALVLQRLPTSIMQVKYSSQARNLGGNPILQRTCTTSPNSVGQGGRMHVIGTDNLARESLTVGATGLPAGSFSLAIYGQTTFAAPYGSGTLCISPFAPGIVRASAQQVDSTGASGTPFFLGTTLGAQVTFAN